MIQASSAKSESFSESDRQLLRDSVRDFLASRWPAGQALTLSADAQAIGALWRGMGMQGLTALGADSTQGGMREILLVFEELGRAACPAPLLGVVAANLALAGRRDSVALLANVHDGKAMVAAAFGALDGAGAAGSVTVSGGILSGRLAYVEGAACASHFLAFSDAPSGVAVVDAGAHGVSVVETPGIPVPALSEVVFDLAPTVFVELDAGVLRDIALVARLACAARALGAADRAFELAVEHAKVRKQFGQFIGQFQAVQHKLANCLINLDGARLALDSAAQARDQGNRDWRVFAWAAIAFAAPALREVAVQCHRALGAIGYAEEHEAPRHFRRVHADVVRMGGAVLARKELADFVLSPHPAGEKRPCMPEHDMGAIAAAFRQEVRVWLDTNWTAEQRAAHRKRPFKERGSDAEFSKLMGRDGWIGIAWPKQYGGQERSPWEQIAFIEEFSRSGAPVGLHNWSESIVAQGLMQHGSPEQQAEWLTAIRRGERSFALGYSEPEAGSDLASLRTRAVRDGDDWIVNGQKIWSSGAEHRDYHWLAVRTDREAKNKHAGISIFMVDLHSPGITVRPSMALYGKTFCSVFYDNVRVPGKNMVGQVNEGWKVISDALAAERVWSSGMRMSTIDRAFEHLAEYLKSARFGDLALKDDPLIRDRIGLLAAELEVARLFFIWNTSMLERGRVPIHEASMGKVFAAELQERLGQTALDILGSAGLLGEEAAGAPVGGEMEWVLRHSIMGMMGGGTNEIQRNVIAIRGLGLPR